MEVYILDSLYRRTSVVDRFESLIWTERWADIGDFELLISSTPVTRSLFTADTAVALNESKRVMLVETIEDNTDAEGRTRLKVKGRSLEKLLEDRMMANGWVGGDLNAQTKWTFTGTPANIVRSMFDDICRYGSVSPADVIPLLQPGTSYPAETIPEPATELGWEQVPAPLLDAIKDICDIFELGFRLYRDGDTGKLLFNVYTGNYRTTDQSALPPAVFSPGLETVQNTTRLMTVESFKNVAYVMSEQGFQIVYADGVDPDATTGTDRRVLMVTAPKLVLEGPDGAQVEPTPAEIADHLIQAGKNELMKNRSLLAFDGEINQRSPYRYGRDYELGDIVEMRDVDGMGNDMRVTEQIFVSDAEGDRSYPTLTMNKFIIPGTWNSWVGRRQWVDFGATEYWNTQP